MYFSLNLSFCSRRHEEAIKEVRIPIKVNVTFWALQVIFFGKSSKTWTFREVENGFNNYTFRSILDASDWNFEDDWSDLTSETPDPKLALSIVFKKFKTLFSFTGVIKFEMNISERDLAADPILREVSECQKLTVNICTEVTEDQLDFLFDQVKVQDSIEIEILKSMGKYEYSKVGKTDNCRLWKLISFSLSPQPKLSILEPCIIDTCSLQRPWLTVHLSLFTMDVDLLLLSTLCSKSGSRELSPT